MEMIGLCFLLSAAGILAFPILVTLVRTLVVLIRNLFAQYWRLVDWLVEKAWQLHASWKTKHASWRAREHCGATRPMP